MLIRDVSPGNSAANLVLGHAWCAHSVSTCTAVLPTGSQCDRPRKSHPVDREYRFVRFPMAPDTWFIVAWFVIITSKLARSCRSSAKHTKVIVSCCFSSRKRNWVCNGNFRTGALICYKVQPRHLEKEPVATVCLDFAVKPARYHMERFRHPISRGSWINAEHPGVRHQELRLGRAPRVTPHRATEIECLQQIRVVPMARKALQ
jgi:hypothetical protein